MLKIDCCIIEIDWPAAQERWSFVAVCDIHRSRGEITKIREIKERPGYPGASTIHNRYTMFNNVPIDVCTTNHCEIVRSLLFINYYVKTLSSNESSVTISISLSDLYPWRSMERYQCHWTVSHFHSNYSPCSWLCCVKFKINPIIRRILLDLRLSSFRLLFRTIQLFYFFTIPLLFHAIQLCIPWRNDF